MQHERASRREAALQARLALSWPVYLKQQAVEEAIKLSIAGEKAKVSSVVSRTSKGGCQAASMTRGNLDPDLYGRFSRAPLLCPPA